MFKNSTEKGKYRKCQCGTTLSEEISECPVCQDNEISERIKKLKELRLDKEIKKRIKKRILNDE